jgi:hypothetical protein
MCRTSFFADRQGRGRWATYTYVYVVFCGVEISHSARAPAVINKVDNSQCYYISITPLSLLDEKGSKILH